MNMDMPEFKSIEEVKEFINSTDAKTFGAISFIDPSGESIQLTMDEFIEKVGLDRAAQFIFDNMDKMSKVETNRDELKKIYKKFKKDPDSLTREEKTALLLLLNHVDNDKRLGVAKGLLNIIVKSFTEMGKELTDTYAGLLGLLLTVMEDTFIVSSDLKVHADNRATYNEIVNSVKEQIVIPEGVDETSLFVALINIIGERFTTSKLTLGMEVDYHEFAERMNLDMDFLFGEDNIVQNTEESELDKNLKNLKNSNLRDLLDLDDRPVAENPFSDNAEKPTTNPFSNTDTKDKIVNLDIRRKLKEDKR